MGLREPSLRMTLLVRVEEKTDNDKNKCKSEIQGSLHCGGKSAAFGRDDVILWEVRETGNSNREGEIRGSSLRSK